MPMNVDVTGVTGEIIKPFGKFNYGDIVNIVKFKISNFDFFKSKAYVCDGKSCYWINMNNIKLMIPTNVSL